MPNDRLQLSEIVDLRRKRVARAAVKAAAAAAEHSDAVAALDEGLLQLAQWNEAHPDPQGSLLEGLNDV